MAALHKSHTLSLWAYNRDGCISHRTAPRARCPPHTPALTQKVPLRCHNVSHSGPLDSQTHHTSQRTPPQYTQSCTSFDGQSSPDNNH